MWSNILKGAWSVMAAILFISELLGKYNKLGEPYQFVADHWQLFWFRTPFLFLMIFAPFSFEIWARIRPQIKVTPISAGFGTPEVTLNVKNDGSVKNFNAKCEVLRARNYPNPVPVGTYDLKWDHTFDRKVSFAKDDSLNLLIASLSGTSLEPVVTLQALNGGQTKDRGWFSWSTDPKVGTLPEFDLKITILSDNAIKPKSYLFTLRPNSGRKFTELVATTTEVPA